MAVLSRRYRNLALRLTIGGLTLALCAIAPATLADTLAQRIDQHISQPRFAAASWGIQVVSLDDGHTVYAHDGGRLLLPASTAKLYTAAFAIDQLGAGYRTHTDVLAAGDIRRGRLHGALVLRGRGDPTLAGDDWADRLASQVSDQGIRRIDAGVVGDDTTFAGSPIGQGWEAADLQAAYGATAGALGVDENTMTASIASDAVSIVPLDAAVTLALQPSDALQVYRAPGSATVHVLGANNEGTGPRRIRLSMADPALTAARRLQAALVRQGIRVDGEARSVHWPIPAPTGTTIASLPSPTLMDILRAGLHRSQNLYLQSVFLLTGLEATGQTAAPTQERAADALAQWLGMHGMGPSSVMIGEGSGLSRHDLTTPGALVNLLALMDATPDAQAWRDLLPLAGVDGTLANRMRGTAAEHNVQAKTGSMSLVNVLAGYVTTASGQRLAFVVMLNNYQPPLHAAGSVTAASADVDAIAIMLAQAAERL